MRHSRESSSSPTMRLCDALRFDLGVSPKRGPGHPTVKSFCVRLRCVAKRLLRSQTTSARVSIVIAGCGAYHRRAEAAVLVAGYWSSYQAPFRRIAMDRRQFLTSVAAGSALALAGGAVHAD